MNHQHGEAFAIMTYRSDDGTETERIWNSRDGVTPFVVTLRSGKVAHHVDWSSDVYAPDHRPQPGERMFVDLTPERARELALRNARQAFAEARPGLDPRVRWATPEAMAETLVAEYLRPGAPDLVEVPASPEGGEPA
ncbi:hypothetical protein [Micromonospora carbonacea]|uniref:Uncharacterized protein n=1 Tax=Micromonospora carbonacea TaxID=47853 RepID=A0A1C4WX03_9ACTN|nr:hypothetical protein [Micromonospora carbonacea]SCF00762.1 hypothetical protein GA0070563_10491 [Micromonospora carbonacea]